MAEIVRAHEYDAVRGVCVHCGDKASENVGEHAGRACVAREIPRAVPSSVFADLGAIGDRAREIREAERNPTPSSLTMAELIEVTTGWYRRRHPDG